MNKQEFIEEQKKIAWQKFEQAPTECAREEVQDFFNELTESIILATEGEMVKRVEECKRTPTHIPIPNESPIDHALREGYNNACDYIISTLTNRI